MAGLHFDITGDNSNFIRKLREAENGVKFTASRIEESGAGIEDMFNRMTEAAGKAGTVIGSALTLTGASSFVQKMFSIRSAFQDTESSMTVFLGSADKAAKFMKELQDYAWYNMFEFSDLTSESAKLLAFQTDVEDVIPTLDKLSNIAAGTNKPLSEFVDLYNKAKSVGKIDAAGLESWASKGVVIVDELKKMGLEVDRSNVKFEHLEKVLNKLTSTGGMFAGLMAEQMSNLSASYGQLQDDVANMFNELGIKYQDVMKQGIEFASVLVDNYEAIGKTILELVVVYGTYRVALAANAAVERIRINLIYEAEIAELKAIATKEKSAFADIEAAVASGKLTKAKAEQVIALRAEIQSKIQSLQAAKAQAYAEHSAAAASYKAALQRHIIAKQNLALAQSQMNIAIRTGTVEEIELARKAAQNAELELNNSALSKNTAHKSLNAAASNRKAASEALDTFQTSANTAAQNVNEKSANLLTLAKTRLAAASKALGLSMLANPYTLVAIAIAGLAYKVYELATAETSAEKSARKHREEQEKFQKTIDEKKQKIEELLRIIQDETETEYAQIKAYEELLHYSPALTAAYTREQLATLELAKSQKILNEERDKANYDNIINQINKYTQFVDRLRNAKTWDDLGDLKGIIKSEYGIGLISNKLEAAGEDLKNYRNQLDEYHRLKKQAEEDAKPVEVKLLEAKADLKQIEDEFAKAEKKLKDEQKKLTESLFYTIPFDVQIEFNNAQSALKNQKAKVSSLENQQATVLETYREAYKKAQANWKAKIKALEDAKKGTKAEYDKAAKDLDEAEKAYKDLGGATDNKAENLRKETEKYKLLLSKQAFEEARAAEDLQMQAYEARINAMSEGSAKTIAQMELNFEKEMRVVDRQKEDALRKKIDDARSVFEANPANKGKTFNPLGIELSDSEIAAFDAMYKAVISKQERTKKELIDKYQDYAAQRLAIEKKFNDDIEVLRAQRKAAEASGNTSLVDQLDRSIAKATKDKGKELISFDFDILKKSPEYVRAFEDLNNTSTETLESLLSQFERFKQTAAETLNPEDLREYTSTIQSIVDELVSRDPFKALSDSQMELVKANKALSQAMKNLDQAEASGDQERVNKATEEYRKSLDGVRVASNKTIKAQKDVNEQMNRLYSALSDVGSAIGGTAGEVIGFIADIGLFVTTSIEAWKTAALATSATLRAVEQASVILAIVSAAIQLIQKLNELIPTVHDQYLKYADKLADINKLTDAVHEYELAVLAARHAEESWFATDNLNSLKQAREYNEKVLGAYIAKAGEAQAIYQNESGGGWLTGAANWIMGNMSAFSPFDWWRDIWGQGGYDKGQTAAINNLRIETRKKSSGFLGTGIGGKSQKTEDLQTWIRNNKDAFKKLNITNLDLFDGDGMVNKELADAVLNNFGDKLVGQTKETLEALVELKEKYDEYLEQLHEYVSSLYEPLVDNFVDSLWDWFDEGKDALDSFKDYASQTFRDIVSDMMRTIILNKVVDGFDKDIADLYEKYASREISNEEDLMKAVSERTNTLIRDYEHAVPTLQNIMSTITGSLEGIGINLKNSESGSSQEATRRGFETMNQDTASELNGRFAAIQMSNEEIKTLAGMIYPEVSEMRLLILSNNEIMTDLRDIALDSVWYLEKISNGVSLLYTMNERLEKIEKNTRNYL